MINWNMRTTEAGVNIYKWQSELLKCTISEWCGVVPFGKSEPYYAVLVYVYSRCDGNVFLFEGKAESVEMAMALCYLYDRVMIAPCGVRNGEIEWVRQ